MTNGEDPNGVATGPIPLPELERLITDTESIAGAVKEQTDTLKATNEVLQHANTALVDTNANVPKVTDQMNTAALEMKAAVQAIEKVVSELTKSITRRMWPGLVVSGIGGGLIVMVLIMRLHDVVGADYYVPLIVGALLTVAGLLVLVNGDGNP
jgi:hypothetical protein